MADLIAKKPTELEVIKIQLDTLEAKVQRIDDDLKQAKIKKHPSIGYYRSRFK